jgi:hypothetical protein
MSRHLLKRAGSEDPSVQRYAADTERISEVLIGASTVAIKGNSEAVNPQFSQEYSFRVSESWS